MARDAFETNVIGVIHLFNLFMPLVLQGKTKKVIAISTGMADAELVNQFDVDTGSIYAASKAALNMIVAKFSAQYKKDGVLFLALSPGFVETGGFDNSMLSCKFRVFIGGHLLTLRHSNRGAKAKGWSHGPKICSLRAALQRAAHA